jgi:hypothetical protein
MGAEMRGAWEWFPRNFLTHGGITPIDEPTNPEGAMQRSYYGLPAAPSVAEAIIQAQLLILKARERETRN